VEIRDLRAFLSVVHHGSFTAAAAELGYTQAAVSHQVAALERELGHTLLFRRPVTPTEAGTRLAEHAARIVLRVDVARSELAAMDAERAEVRVVTAPDAAIDVLAEGLRGVRALAPTSRVLVATAGTCDAIEELSAGRADLVLVAGISGPGEPTQLVEAGLVRSMALVEEPCVIALPLGHPLGRRRRLDLATLRHAPWVHVPVTLEPGTRHRLSELESVVRSAEAGHDEATVLSLVAAGLGVALLPSRPHLRHAGVVTVPLADPGVVHRTTLLTLREVRPAAARLVTALLAAARQRREPWSHGVDLGPAGDGRR
jgi:DNA-binding transcriptional LysR family regulator